MGSEGASGSCVARRAVVAGRVQGVWFRDSVRRRADSLGVAGWVRNRADGSVELWAEGRADAVEGLIDFAREGPPRASVQRVEVQDEAPAGLERFEVR